MATLMSSSLNHYGEDSGRDNLKDDFSDEAATFSTESDNDICLSIDSEIELSTEALSTLEGFRPSNPHLKCFIGDSDYPGPYKRSRSTVDEGSPVIRQNYGEKGFANLSSPRDHCSTLPSSRGSSIPASPSMEQNTVHSHYNSSPILARFTPPRSLTPLNSLTAPLPSKVGTDGLISSQWPFFNSSGLQAEVSQPSREILTVFDAVRTNFQPYVNSMSAVNRTFYPHSGTSPIRNGPQSFSFNPNANNTPRSMGGSSPKNSGSLLLNNRTSPGGRPVDVSEMPSFMDRLSMTANGGESMNIESEMKPTEYYNTVLHAMESLSVDGREPRAAVGYRAGVPHNHSGSISPSRRSQSGMGSAVGSYPTSSIGNSVGSLSVRAPLSPSQFNGPIQSNGPHSTAQPSFISQNSVPVNSFGTPNSAQGFNSTSSISSLNRWNTQVGVSSIGSSLPSVPVKAFKIPQQPGAEGPNSNNTSFSHGHGHSIHLGQAVSQNVAPSISINNSYSAETPLSASSPLNHFSAPPTPTNRGLFSMRASPAFSVGSMASVNSMSSIQLQPGYNNFAPSPVSRPQMPSPQGSIGSHGSSPPPFRSDASSPFSVTDRHSSDRGSRNSFSFTNGPVGGGSIGNGNGFSGSNGTFVQQSPSSGPLSSNSVFNTIANHSQSTSMNSIASGPSHSSSAHGGNQFAAQNFSAPVTFSSSSSGSINPTTSTSRIPPRLPSPVVISSAPANDPNWMKNIQNPFAENARSFSSASDRLVHRSQFSFDSDMSDNIPSSLNYPVQFLSSENEKQFVLPDTRVQNTESLYICKDEADHIARNSNISANSVSSPFKLSSDQSSAFRSPKH